MAKVAVTVGDDLFARLASFVVPEPSPPAGDDVTGYQVPPQVVIAPGVPLAPTDTVLPADIVPLTLARFASDQVPPSAAGPAQVALLDRPTTRRSPLVNPVWSAPARMTDQPRRGDPANGVRNALFVAAAILLMGAGASAFVLLRAEDAATTVPNVGPTTTLPPDSVVVLVPTVPPPAPVQPGRGP